MARPPPSGLGLIQGWVMTPSDGRERRIVP